MQCTNLFVFYNYNKIINNKIKIHFAKTLLSFVFPNDLAINSVKSF